VDWVKLAVRYYADEKIAKLPDEATELMFVRGLARAGEEKRGGFIPEYALPELTRRRRYGACVDALTASGLWTRANGGYQITNWSDWQDALDVLAKRREADRDRKRVARAAERQALVPSADNSSLSADMSADVRSLEEEKDKEPRGRSKRDTYVAREAGPEPPRQCAEHLEDPDPPPCGRCKRTRQVHEQWEQQWQREEQLARHAEAQARAEAKQVEIDRCRLCDSTGKVGGLACRHDPGIAGRTRRGAPLAAAAIKKPERRSRDRPGPVEAARQPGTSLDPLDAKLAQVIQLHAEVPDVEAG
jgi:hypothetical protein